MTRGSAISIEMISNIVDSFEYETEDDRQKALELCHRNIYDETRLDDLRKMAQRYAIDDEQNK